MQRVSPSQRPSYVFFFLLILSCFAFVIRLLVLLPFDFPVSDGGMFYTMAQDLRANAYHLPVVTSYNHSDIPFIYPPLGIYLPPILGDLLGWPLAKILQFLPLIITTLSIPLFYSFASQLLHSPVKALYAVIAYAFMPATFSWTIMGGGTPRALGLLFAILTLHQAHALYTQKKARYIWTTGFCAAGVALSHPIAAWASFYSTIMLFLFFSRHRKSLLDSMGVVLLMLLMMSPWLVPVIRNHGIAPFLSAGQTGHQGIFAVSDLLRFDFSGEIFFRAVGFIGVLGLFSSVKQRNFFIPAWLIINPLIQPRGMESFIILPLALSFSVGLVDVILPGLSQTPKAKLDSHLFLPAAFEQSIQHPIQKAFVALLIWQMLVNAFLGCFDLVQGSTHPNDREAMQWIALNTPESSRFVVLTGSSHPLLDPTAEWFPALSQRKSLTTIQGQEWLLQGNWNVTVGDMIALQACWHYQIACLEDKTLDLPYTHLYVRQNTASKTDSFNLSLLFVESAKDSPDFELVYSNPEVSIFAHNPR
jgi:hypothetical protein